MPTFRDYSGIERDTIEEFALMRATHSAPLLGGAECPAAEYTFAVADARNLWRNPTRLEREQLVQLVVRSGHCCRNLGDRCPLRTKPGPGECNHNDQC